MITDLELIKLNKEFNQLDKNITMQELRPLHDEEFSKGWVICVDNIIVANANNSYEVVREQITRYINN